MPARVRQTDRDEGVGGPEQSQLRASRSPTDDDDVWFVVWLDGSGDLQWKSDVCMVSKQDRNEVTLNASNSTKDISDVKTLQRILVILHLISTVQTFRDRQTCTTFQTSSSSSFRTSSPSIPPSLDLSLSLPSHPIQLMPPSLHVRPRRPLSVLFRPRIA